MKTVVLIDGGYLRAAAKSVGKTYDISFVEKFAQACLEPGEYLLRVLYYDAPPFVGSVQLPVSGNEKKFTPKDTFLGDLAKVERFACRAGSLGFRGWKPRKIPVAGVALTDADFAPVIEQRA